MARSRTGLLALVMLGGLTASAAAQSQVAALLPPGQAVAAAPAAVEGAAPAVVPGSPLSAALADSVVGPLPPPAGPVHAPYLAHSPNTVPFPSETGEHPYFEPDPLLDPPELPLPGCFGEVDLLAVEPHVRYWSNLAGTVILPGGGTDMVSVPGAHLAWTVAPRILLGYRLPSGFGEFTVAWRYMASDGSQALPGPDGLSDVRSRLDVTVVDFDYRSSEFSLWPCCMDMRWWAGGRFSNLYFDSRQVTAPALAALGTGVVDRHVTNRYVGFGPHAGVELAYCPCGRALSLLGRIEGAGMIGRIRQSFAETTTGLDASGLPISGNTPYSSSQDVPMITAQIGVCWKPASHAELFVGYQYEHFWNPGRLSNISTEAEIFDHVVVVRASFSF
jgi:hypothetical protein